MVITEPSSAFAGPDYFLYLQVFSQYSPATDPVSIPAGEKVAEHLFYSSQTINLCSGK